MNLFKKSLKPSWTFPRSPENSNKKIWRLLPGSGILAVELRDVDKKEVEFAGIDLNTGAPLWQNLQLEEKWWVNINKIYQDVLLLQQFVRPDMPQPGKIFAVDIFTGKILWQDEAVEFLNAADGRVYGIRRTFQSEEVIGLNPKTGEAEIALSVDDPRSRVLNNVFEPEEYSLPVPLEEAEETRHGDVANVAHVFPAGAKSPTIIKSSSGKEVAGYHVQSGTDGKGIQTFDSLIKIADPDGKVIFEDRADSGVYTTLQDFYFVVNEELIYVRNSNEVVAVKLDDK